MPFTNWKSPIFLFVVERLYMHVIEGVVGVEMRSPSLSEKYESRPFPLLWAVFSQANQAAFQFSLSL